MLSNNTQIKKEFEISWSLNLVLSRIILKFERISDLIDCSSGIYSFKNCDCSSGIYSFKNCEECV